MSNLIAHIILLREWMVLIKLISFLKYGHHHHQTRQGFLINDADKCTVWYTIGVRVLKTLMAFR